jgi:CRISPR system Cascade subunit CasE
MLGNPYRIHAAIAGSFPNWAEAARNVRPLWRLDIEPSGAACLYIVSSTEPSLVGLNEQIGFPDLPPVWRSRAYDPLLSQLESGQLWSFRLTANPVHTITRGSVATPQGAQDISGKRIGHVTVRQQAAWLIGADSYTDLDTEQGSTDHPLVRESRARRNGFEVPLDDHRCAQLVVSDRQRLNLRKGGQSKSISLVTARFDGILRVTDPVKLRHALTHGIGHAKAFGCGLLTLAPLP